MAKHNFKFGGFGGSVSADWDCGGNPPEPYQCECICWGHVYHEGHYSPYNCKWDCGRREGMPQVMKRGGRVKRGRRR